MRRIVVAVACVLAVGGILGAFASANAQPAPRPAVEDHFTPADVERARAYRAPRYAVGFTAMGIGVVAAGLLGLGRGSRLLGEATARATGGRWWMQTLLLVVVVSLVPVLATLPFRIARHRHDTRFGLATDSTAGFLADMFKGVGFNILLVGIGALLFVGLARALPRGWPIVVSAAAAVFVFVGSFLIPLLYEPAFNRFTPAPAEVRDRVLDLAQRSGVRVDDVLVADASRRTTRLNAYVSGLGSTKRVVLYDTLLERAPPDEVDVVVAHELAHDANRDVLRLTLLGVAGVIGGVLLLWLLLRVPALRASIGASGPGDPRVVPFVVFFIAAATIVTMPLANGFSRQIEERADRDALRRTNDPQAAVSLEVTLARANIADLTPNGFVRWMFFTHPPVLERIGYALEHARANPAAPPG